MNQFTHAKSKWVLVLVWVGFMSLTQACKKEQEVDPGFGPNGEPRILSVKIPDIPDQNIRIDQDAKQIVVTVPTSYSARAIQPTLTVTPNTILLGNQPYSIYATDDASKYPIKVQTTGNKLTSYALVLKPAGELTFGTLSGPQTYSISDQNVYVQLPVYNYVDGTSYQDSKVTLINQTSGERITPDVTATSREAVGTQNQAPRTDGAMVITLYLNGYSTYYPPGQYTVELTKPNGRKATLTQPIQLSKGPIKGRFDVNFPLQLNSGEYLLYGSGYYRDDKVSLRIQGANQQALTLDALGFIDKQPGIRLPTVLNLKPGYYYAQLIVNGVPTSSTGRIAISEQAKPLIIQSMGVAGQSPYKELLSETYSFDTPITLVKGTGYTLITNYFLLVPNDNNATRRVRLTLLADRSRVYDIPYGPSVTTSGDMLQLPASIPSGQYEFTVQVIRGDGSVINGIPLERPVVIQ